MLGPGDRAPRFEAQPVFGLPVRLPDPEGRPLALAFVSSLGNPFARESLCALQRAWPELDRRGARLLAVTRSGPRAARDFVPRRHLLYPLVTDPVSGGGPGLFEAWRVPRDPGFRQTLRSLRNRPPWALFRLGSTLKTLVQGGGKLEGAGDQLPATFLVDGDGTILFARYGESVFELPDVDGLLTALG